MGSTRAAARVLLIDDDTVLLEKLAMALTRAGFEVSTAADPMEGLAAANDPGLDVVVTDLQMPGLSGIELLKAIKTAQPELEVMMISGYGTIDLAVETVKLGAYDFLTKPFSRLDDFTLRVTRAVEHRRLMKRAVAAEAALEKRAQFEGIIGQSAQMQAVFKLVEAVAASTATVLIRGESGTGKELVARAIHDRGPRRARPFVAINCSALSDTLLESELFGHAKGAFTGALGLKRGLFEVANGGTIFLDEIGDVPLATQVKMLRVLQEGEIKRVGETTPVSVDVRVIAATNVDLGRAMAEGTFREDLYYRLNVVTIYVPALRERPSDVPLLAQHFLARYAEKSGKKRPEITPAAMELLMRSPWVGNVRELENVMQRAVVLDTSGRIDVEALPAHQGSSPTTPTPAEGTAYELAALPFAQAKALVVNAFERRYLSTLMEQNGNKLAAAALAAGMDRSNFRRLLKDNGLHTRSTPEGDGTG